MCHLLLSCDRRTNGPHQRQTRRAGVGESFPRISRFFFFVPPSLFPLFLCTTPMNVGCRLKFCLPAVASAGPHREPKARCGLREGRWRPFFFNIHGSIYSKCVSYPLLDHLAGVCVRLAWNVITLCNLPRNKDKPTINKHEQ